MVDRRGWQAKRIAAGDLDVIRPTIDVDGAALAPQLREAILAGLSVAIASGEVWKQARAIRLQGEMQEQTGDVDAAIDSYEKALTIDPQVGVSRRLAKLQKVRSLKTGKAPAAKVSRFEQQARRLGIEHELVPLERGSGKEWRMLPSGTMGPVEMAALDHYATQGWSGAAAEGGLMLTLLKAASFDALPARHADTFIEALYAQNVAFPEDRFEHGTLLRSVSRASRAQIEHNWKIIAATAGETPAFYPAVRAEHVFALFDQLGPRRLRDVAELFAQAPYDLRAGWPDLTLWRDGEIRFVEVKAPGDSMHASQARLISTILVPLSFNVGIAEVRPA
ncbi:VRR-NUC domain-containing protein [Rhizorhapis sp. SPR117]|uniref:VRR-NUC domain-containing protein n=1 Tax=Rhizorhapis sp. SPR117 TaxID=2912611 RepID=UPI001F020F93|nr:VRR-NUC domain-containing protein [Rhizorhapis sp. SPR117]